jgi:hypothetical protein
MLACGETIRKGSGRQIRVGKPTGSAERNHRVHARATTGWALDTQRSTDGVDAIGQALKAASAFK